MLVYALTDIGELYKTVRNLHKEGATKNPHDPNRRCKEQGVVPPRGSLHHHTVKSTGQEPHQV
jgi:hypothetical protein